MVPSLGIILTLHEAGSTHWTGRGQARGYSGAATFTVLVQPTEAALPSDRIRTFRYIRLTRPIEVKLSEESRDLVHQQLFKRLCEKVPT